MNLQNSHLIFLTGMTIYIVIRAIFQIRGMAHKKAVNKATIGDMTLVILVALGQIVFPLLAVITPWFKFADYALPPAALWVGAPLMFFSLWLFWRSHADLGNAWSVTLKIGEQHKLVTQGVYRSVRHPMYLSFFLFAVSQILLIHNWLGGWAAFAAVLLLYVIRRPNEERMMIEHFGAEYQAYMNSTSGLMPRLLGSKKLTDPS